MDWLNDAPDDRLAAELTACCAARSWVAALLAGRPFADRDALFAASDAAVAELTDAGLAEALAAHPRIGDRTGEAWSRQEQAGMASASADLQAGLATANAAYEQRFGQVYLVCATGKSAEELLAICRSRLGNDPATERAVVLDELAKISRLRLGKLLDREATAQPGNQTSSLSTHVLDATTGRPAAGVAVRLESWTPDGWTAAGQQTTDADGRIPELGSPAAGRHRITFETGEYFTARGIATFYPEVSVVFEVTGAGQHHHVPLLLGPYGYTTYRGS